MADGGPLTHPPISVITWVNDRPLYDGLIKRLLCNVGADAWGPPDVELVPVMPGDGARNLGQAYNIGKSRASHRIKAYLHQDLAVVDSRWDFKIASMLADEGVGGTGFIGCRGVFGPMATWSPPETWAGARANPYRYEPECQEVWLVDAMGFITTQEFDWAECYEAQHFAVEDYCMQPRRAALEVWTVDVRVKHLSAGQLVGEDFWRSARLFRERWKHMLPPEPVPLDRWKGIYGTSEAVEEQRLLTERRRVERAHWLELIERAYPE